MFEMKYRKQIVEAEEKQEFIESDNNGEGKIILKVNDKEEAIVEYEYDQEHCWIQFLETYVHENQGYATKLLLKLKEILKRKNIKTVSAQATLKSQHLLTKVFGEPIKEPEELWWDEGIGDDLWSVKHNINESYLVEARSTYILENQKLINAVAERYLKNILSPSELKKWLEAENANEENLKCVKNNILPRLENEQHPYISKYLGWVLKQYALGKWIFPEDISKLEEELEKFNKLNHTLDSDKRDINHYSFEDFTKLSLELEEMQTKGEEERLIKNNEVKRIFENDKWRLIQPLTKEADIIYGKGTRWCTASTKYENWFDHYNRQGPLYILINKKDKTEKYQFHWESRQFMNKYDDPITDEEQEFILSDPELKAKLKEIAASKLSSENNSDNKSLIDKICEDLNIYTNNKYEADSLIPDENGICHLVINEDTFSTLYHEHGDNLSWDFVKKIFNGEGFVLDYDYYDYYTEADYCDLTEEQISKIYEIFDENNLLYIANSDIEKLIMGKLPDSKIVRYVYSDLFDEINEQSDVSTRYSDCWYIGSESAAINDIEEQILDYFGYNAAFDWVTTTKRRYNAEKNEYESYNTEEKVIKLDVPAKDLEINLNKEDIVIFPISNDDYYSDSFSEYLMKTLYDDNYCSCSEPYYGWQEFDKSEWKSFIDNEYIPTINEVLTKNAKTIQEKTQKYEEKSEEEKEDFDESVSSLNKATEIIKERNLVSKNNTFKKVFKKINEQQLEEGKFGKALGALATAATIGLGGLHATPASADTFNQGYKDQIVWAMDNEIPEWIQDAGGISVKGDYIFSVQEVVRDYSSDIDRYDLPDVALQHAKVSIVRTFVDNLNRAVKDKLNPMSTQDIFVQGFEQVSEFVLLQKEDSGKHYHAYGKARIEKHYVQEMLVRGLHNANPDVDIKQITKIVNQVMDKIIK